MVFVEFFHGIFALNRLCTSSKIIKVKKQNNEKWRLNWVSQTTFHFENVKTLVKSNDDETAVQQHYNSYLIVLLSQKHAVCPSIKGKSCAEVCPIFENARRILDLPQSVKTPGPDLRCVAYNTAGLYRMMLLFLHKSQIKRVRGVQNQLWIKMSTIQPNRISIWNMGDENWDMQKWNA